MPRSTAVAPRVSRQQFQQEVIDEVIVAAVALARRSESVVRATRELGEAINQLVAARDKEGEDERG